MAFKIAHELSSKIYELFSEDILFICLIGSLASGNYIPGKSDIDLKLILKERNSLINNQCKDLIHSYEIYYDLNNLVEIFIDEKKNLFPPYNFKQINLFEIARIKYQAKILIGEFDVQNIPIPSINEFQKSFRLLYENYKKNSTIVLTKSNLKKIVIEIAKYDVLFHYGQIEFDKNIIIKKCLCIDEEYKEILIKNSNKIEIELLKEIIKKMFFRVNYQLNKKVENFNDKTSFTLL